MSEKAFLKRGLALIGALACAVFATRIAAALEASSAQALLRAIGAALGAVLMLSGNFLPKMADPLSSRSRHRARRNSATRLMGWLFTLTGIGVIAIFLFAPLSDAPLTASALAVGAFAASAALALWERTGPSFTIDPPTE
ncbi:MAG: hypothetical protein ACKVS5_01260 [Parvularculaceae bacterium]